MLRKIALLTLTVLSFSFSYELYKGAFLVDRVLLLPFVLEYSSVLGLSPQQERKIKDYALRHEREIEKRAKLVRYLEIEAKRRMLEGAAPEEIKELLTDVMLLKRELSLKNAECLRFLKKTLTQEQFRMLKDIALIRLLEEFK